MAARKDKRKGWIVDFVMAFPDGKKKRVRETSPLQSNRGAEQYERERREVLFERWVNRKRGVPDEKEVPTFATWWNGRFWRERVIGARNSHSEKESKTSIYNKYLEVRFANLRLDQIINDGHIPAFRAELIDLMDKGKFGEARFNNILTPLGTALRYAKKQGIIAFVPDMGLLKIDPPEIKWWDFYQYARILASALAHEPEWYVAACLAGEAGLRIGEIRALVWERDLDLIAGTLTVNRQVRHGVEGKPKGRRRRSVPMTSTLLAALKGMSVVRRGLVVRNPDGSPIRDGQTTHSILRICRKAGLPERAWHCMRHTFGTHAAMLGVNPWSLMVWLGHQAITTTHRYVHVAGAHRRPFPEAVKDAGKKEDDPDLRVIEKLGARFDVHNHGTILAPKENAGTSPA